MKNKLDNSLPEDLRQVDSVITEMAPYNIDKKGSDKEGAVAGLSLAGASAGDESSFQGQGPNNKNGEKSMADAINKDDLKKEVAAILAEKDAAKQVEARIASLEAEKAQLAQELEEVSAAKDTLSSDLETAKAELESKNQEFEALAAEKEESVTKASELQAQLDEIRAEQTLASRKAVLVEANILMPEGEKQEGQLAKVKAMSEEAFAGYVDELSTILSTAKAETADNGEEDDTQTAQASQDSGQQEPVKTTASAVPANLEEGQKLSMSIAAASAQVSLEDDKVQTYANM